MSENKQRSAGELMRDQLVGSVRAGDLVRDGRLSDAQEDRLDHAAIARVVAEVALTAAPPVNIALFGPYGAGKSSIYSMVREHVQNLDRAVKVVRYDAWKYGGKDLKRNFIASVAADLGVKDPRFSEQLHRNAETANLRIGYWLQNNWKSLGVGLTAAALCALVAGGVAVLARVWLTDSGWRDAVVNSAPGVLPVFGLIFAALVVGQRALEGAVEKIVLAPPEGDDQFSERFHDLLTCVKATGDHPLVVFIDELDRCSEEDVVSTLVDLKTFLDQKRCVFIVAVDRDVVEQALNKVPQSKPVRGVDPYYATRGAFLDKIFQHQISLPPLRPKVLTRLARDLVSDADGLWKELREYDRQRFDKVVFALVPAHLSSPRRVKVLLNAYATNIRIAERRGIEWLDRAEELAVLTVIQTEFPAVAADLVRAPRLLSVIRGGPTAASEDLRAIAERYQVDQPEKGAGEEVAAVNPAGELLADEETDAELEVARETSARHLSEYLAKIAAVGLDDPRPDLYYLQSAGLVDGLIEKKQSDAIDQSTNTAPERTVAVFEGEPSKTICVAVNLLVAEGERDYGPGRLFAYEAACLLVEQIDPTDVPLLDRTVPGAVLAAIGEPGWPLEAAPGALLLATLFGQDHNTGRLLRALQDPDVDVQLLTRASKALQTASEDFGRTLAAVLAGRYAASPEPLHAALAGLSGAAAQQLWDTVGSDVMDVLSKLELPAPAPTASSSSPATRATRAAAQAAVVSTGDGCRRLVALVDVLLERASGEQLLSTVFQQLLEQENEDLLAQAEDLAPKVLGAMEDDSLVNSNVFSALRGSEMSSWQRWTSLLRPPVMAADVAQSAREIVTDVLLPQLSEAAVDNLNYVQKLAGTIVPHCGVAEADTGTVSKFEAAVEAVRWHGDLEEVDWKRRRVVAWDVVTTLGTVVGSTVLDRMLVNDVLIPVQVQALDTAAVDEIIARIDALERRTAETVSEELDEYIAQDGEQLALLQLRLKARSCCNGMPLDPAELVHLDDSPGATSAFGDWLSLGPSGEDVAGQVQRISISPARPSLENWAKHATDEGRTQVWIALQGTHATTSLLRAVGQYGVTAAVVSHMMRPVLEGRNQGDRNSAFEVLETAKLGADPGSGIEKARRAASELAQGLLELEHQGDARLALRVVIWAGGPGYGHTTTLRRLFKEAVARYDGLFSKQEKKRLEQFNLHTKRNAFDRLRG